MLLVMWGAGGEDDTKTTKTLDQGKQDLHLSNKRILVYLVVTYWLVCF